MGYKVMVRLLIVGLLAVPTAAHAAAKEDGPIVETGKFIQKKLSVGETRIISLDKPAEGRRLVTDKTEVAAAGFISNIERGDVTIAGDASGIRDIFSSGDRVLLASKRALAPDTLLLTCIPMGEVQDPVTGKILGKTIKTTGIIRVGGRTGGKYEGVVETAFYGITGSDILIDFKPAEPIYEPIPKNPALHGAAGYVVATKEARQLTSPGDIVYLDLSEKDGLKVGDRLSVRRSGDMTPGYVSASRYVLPDIAVAVVTVISVGPDSSVAKVISATEPVAYGYKAVYGD